jgi:hypothetical protein
MKLLHKQNLLGGLALGAIFIASAITVLAQAWYVRLPLLVVALLGTANLFYMVGKLMALNEVSAGINSQVAEFIKELKAAELEFSLEQGETSTKDLPKA